MSLSFLFNKDTKYKQQQQQKKKKKEKRKRDGLLSTVYSLFIPQPASHVHREGVSPIMEESWPLPIPACPRPHDHISVPTTTRYPISPPRPAAPPATCRPYPGLIADDEGDTIMATPTDSSRFITLPTTPLPNGILRFINVTESLHTVVTDGEMLLGTPLFFATDVLTGTSVTADNQPRIHARYGKQGLATKLTFPSGTKVHGLHGTSRGLWFYNIVGALKVTFEFHSPDQQVAMMDALQDVWRKKYKDPPLPSSIVVQHVQDDRSKNRGVDFEASLQGSNLLFKDGTTGNEGQTIKNGVSVQREIESGGNRTSLKRHHIISIGNTVPKRKRTLEEFENGPVLKIDRCTSTDEPVVQLGGVTDLQVHHVEEVLTEREPPTSSSDQVRCWCGSVQRRLQELSERCGDEILSEELMCSMEHVVEMLHVMTRGEIDTCLQLLNSVSDAVCENETSLQTQDGEVSQRQSSDRVSGVLAEWLGSKFNREVSRISERVVEFKQRNIDQINNLPQAKKLVNTLFPKPMVDFIMTWLGTRTERRMASSEPGVTLDSHANELDHDSSRSTDGDDHSRDSARSRKRRHTGESDSCYPLAQFILELANQTLISGMAHVIYPRLLQNTNI